MMDWKLTPRGLLKQDWIGAEARLLEDALSSVNVTESMHVTTGGCLWHEEHPEPSACS